NRAETLRPAAETRGITQRGPGFPRPSLPYLKPGEERELFGGAGGLHHVHAAHAARHAGAGRLLLGGLGDDGLGREDVLRDRSRVLQRGADDHRRVGDPGLDQVLVLAGLDVESVALRAVADLVDDDRALEARVVGELPDRLLARPQDNPGTGALVAVVVVEVDRLDPPSQLNAAARDHPLLPPRATRLARLPDPVL